MSFSRFSSIFRLELAQTLKRPMLWVLVALLALFTWGFSLGNVTIQSGDAAVGGTKAWITSEFNFAFLLCFLVALIYSFFLSIASGMSVIQDDDLKVGEILHATPLRPGEYIWGKFAAILTAFLGVLAVHLALAMFFNHVPPNVKAEEIRGPFEIFNYLRPAFVFALPTMLFFAGVCFYLGERFRRPITVFLFPMVVMLGCAFFLWSWAPTWLDPAVNQLLMWVDPGGFRWLNETWLKADRGADFYNKAPIGLEPGFVASRLAFAFLGLAGVALAQRHFTRRLRGSRDVPGSRRKARAGEQAAALPAAPARSVSSLGDLGMTYREPGFFSGAWTVARTELRNLLHHAGLYLFLILILIETLGNSLTALGAFQTRLLLTPGLLAIGSFNSLSLMICLLLLFYTVESLERERASGLFSISYATPVKTASLLFGKTLANSLVGVLAIFATFIAVTVALLIQGTVPFRFSPFALVWGLLLFPTFLLWTSFVTAVQGVFARRYLTYGLGLGVVALMGYLQVTGHMNWVGNWWLWESLQWTDMGLFELDRKALVLSRLTALGMTALFIAVAVQGFARREADAIGVFNRARPAVFLRRALRFAPALLVPLVTGTMLYLAVYEGFQGEKAKKLARDYWRQNLGTWKDAPMPALAGVDLAVELEPENRFLKSQGTYVLLNDRPAPLARFALTGGPHWKKVAWTINGKAYEPENRSGLYVFTPPGGLSPGQKLAIGFRFEGRIPEGITENGGGASEFILPSGVVLTAFSTSMVPQVGFDEGRGVEDENRYEPKVYPPDFYKEKLDPLFASPSAFTTRVRITAPAAYTLNSVGTLVSDEVRGGKRTVVWQSDQPVRLFNIVAGRYAVREKGNTKLFYHPEHGYNVEEMSDALAAARRYYSEWFYPYPWKELKVSEFPALAGYAQGFPTNISFSESIGFLTKSDLKTKAAFLVTAHEAAHQWWGNILTPGKGPGGNILSEGMSHFSTLLLLEKVKGEGARIEFAKRIEERYGDSRRVDAERPLVEIDGSKGGDTTVMYDKGGWVFWMLANHMGRERNLAGLRQFIATYKDGPDYPVLQDFTAAMRPFAPDPAAYDAFVKQWFHEVVVPEYELTAPAKRKLEAPGGWEVAVKVKNQGKGRMPVEVAATTGVDRYDDTGKPAKGYRDARVTVLLGAGEEKLVTLRAPFEPKSVLVDPDAKVLQVRRKNAVTKL